MSDERDMHIADPELQEIFIHLFFAMDIAAHFFPRHAIKRRLCDIDKIVFDKSRHMAIEECQKQRADMGAVDVGIGHDDDFMVAELLKIEIVHADPAAKSRDHRADFCVLQDLFKTRFFDVENLTADGQDRLKTAVASCFGRAARRISLDDIDLAESGIFLLAIGQFSRKTRAIERRFTQRQFARFLRRFARLRSENRFFDDDAWQWLDFLPRKVVSSSPTICCTTEPTSLLPSRCFVCPSN